MAENGTIPALSDPKSNGAAGDVTAGGGGGHDGVRGASTSSTTTAVSGQQQKEQDTATTSASGRPVSNGKGDLSAMLWSGSLHMHSDGALIRGVGRPPCAGSSLNDGKQQQQQNGSRGEPSSPSAVLCLRAWD